MKSRAAVFVGVGKPFDLREFPLPEAELGGLIVRTTMSTICGSDLHTWQGKRGAPLPIILGHEITGEIVEMGEGVDRDVTGNRLRRGDRITWTIMASCGMCYYCAIKNLPQKCVDLFKYGHESCDKPPHLNGGFAEHVCIKPGTGVFKIPDTLSDDEVVPINCTLATAINGIETIGCQLGDSVVIQGAGMLGLYTSAVLREMGAGKIVLADKDAARLELAGQFGADLLLNIRDRETEDIVEEIRNLTGGHGVDLVVEACGAPSAIPEGVQMLRKGGRYLIMGTVFPEANFVLDGYLITTKILTMKGIHNYSVRHLGEALGFVERNRGTYPFERLIVHRFPLEEMDRAFEMSAAGAPGRIAVIPG